MMREALAVLRSALPPGHQNLATTLNNLATLLMTKGELAEAQQLFEEALQIQRAALPPGHPSLARAMNNLGTLYWRQGRFELAIPLFESALEMRAKELGRLHPETLGSIANLGVNYSAVGRTAEALGLLEEAFEGAQREPSVAWVAVHLLEVYGATADAAKPHTVTRFVSLARRQMPLVRDELPKASPELAVQLAWVSAVLLRVREWDEAEPLLRECLAIRREKEPDGWRTFGAMSMLGGALLGQKKFAEAEPLLLDGVRGMRERAASIPATSAARVHEALERLVQLYEAKLDAAQADVWRSELEAARAVAAGAANGGL